jgi:hypothetical protein
VATTRRTPNNIYVLNFIGRKKCFLGKENEHWLSHKRMGNKKFDNLFEISKMEEMKEIPEISKPRNTLWEHCLQGKQTRTKFKLKEYSMKKPLDIVDIDLCGPTRTKGLNGEQYCMLLIDDYTRMVVVFFLRKKLEAFKHFKIYKEMVES